MGTRSSPYPGWGGFEQVGQCPCTIHLRDQRVAEQTGNKVNQHMNNKDQKGGGVGEGAVDQCGSFIFKKEYPDLVNRPLDACFNALSLYTLLSVRVVSRSPMIKGHSPCQKKMCIRKYPGKVSGREYGK